jgi:hypothetical protein
VVRLRCRFKRFYELVWKNKGKIKVGFARKTTFEDRGFEVTIGMVES